MRSGANVQRRRCEELRFLADFWEGAEPRAPAGLLRPWSCPELPVPTGARCKGARARCVSSHCQLYSVRKQVLQGSEIDCVMHFTWFHARHAEKAQDKVTRPTRYNEGLTNQIQSQLLHYVQGSIRQSLRQGSRWLFDSVIRERVSICRV